MKVYNNSKYVEQPAKCPECGNLMADMGLDFESPKKSDVKAWAHMKTLYSVGVTFHSCGCSGPGYIPNDKDELIAYFSRIKDCYLEYQRFWSARKVDPETQSEIDKDRNKNWALLSTAPDETRTGNRRRPKYDVLKAQQYWNTKVLEVEQKIALLAIE